MTENTSGIEYTKINQQWSKQRFRYLFNKKWENKGNKTKGHAQNKQRRQAGRANNKNKSVRMNGYDLYVQ